MKYRICNSKRENVRIINGSKIVMCSVCGFFKRQKEVGENEKTYRLVL